MTQPSTVALSARTAALCLPLPGARYRLPHTVAWRLTAVDADVPSREGPTDLAVMIIYGLSPATRYRFEADGFAHLEFETPACAGLIEARQFGIRPDVEPDDRDGTRANAEAIADALASVPTGGTLRLPSGIWTIPPIRLKSDMTLELAEGAVLRAPSMREGWPILPARDDFGHMLGSWEGLPDACFAAPVYAIDARNITIEGAGILDGSGHLGDWWTWPKETRSGARRPRGLHLISCKDVTLLGFTIRNAPSWTIHPQGCEGLVAAGLAIEAPHDSPNTDGLNPESCRDVTIAGVRFSVGDDCIAIKAGKRIAGCPEDHLGETRGVQVRHCLMERGHGGLVIGSEMSGGVHDVTIEDCDMIGTDRGLRLKTRRGRGGAITGITMRRVLMDGVQTALSANAYYHCDADGHDHWVQSRVAAPLGPGTPIIDGVSVDDVEIRGLAHAAGVFLGLPEAPIRNVRIRRVTVASHCADAVATPPIMADQVRPMRHEAIVAEYADIDCDDPALLSTATISLPLDRDNR